MLRVALYNRNLNDPRPSGIKTVVVEVVRRLLRDPAERFHFTCLSLGAAETEHLRSLFGPGPLQIVECRMSLRRLRLRWLFGGCGLRSLLGPHDIFWSAAPWPFGMHDTPFVATLNDFYPLHVENAKGGAIVRKRLSALWFWLGARTAFSRAAVVAPISHSTAEELRKRFPALKAAIDVVHLGVDESHWSRPPATTAEQFRSRFGIPPSGSLFLCVGAHQANKNFWRVIEAFRHVADRLNPPPALLIIGPEGPETPALRACINENRLDGRVMLAGTVSGDELHAAVCHATALVFPSLMEGFGIPILDAFAAGTPVITGNITSMPEIAGDAALLVNPFDARAISSAMIEVAADSGRREQLVRAGRERVKSFTWDATAARYAEIFTALAASRGPQSA